MTKPNSTDQYATALDQLDVMQANGQVSANQFAVRRAKLIAEASASAPPSSVRFLVTLGTVIAVVLLVGIVLTLLTTFLQSV